MLNGIPAPLYIQNAPKSHKEYVKQPNKTNTTRSTLNSQRRDRVLLQGAPESVGPVDAHVPALRLPEDLLHHRDAHLRRAYSVTTNISTNYM